MYGGATYDWRNDPLVGDDDDTYEPCVACDEPGEECIGGRVYCPTCADRAGRNGYR